MKPHIAVNTRLLMKGSTEGISRYEEEVLSRLAIRHPEVQFSFLFDRPYHQDYVYGSNVTPYVVPPQARHPVLWYLFFHHTLPRKIRQLKPDLIFSPELYTPQVPEIPRVSVFHDLAYEYYPKDMKPWASRYILKYSRIYAHQADHLLTVSEDCKQDLMKFYRLGSDKVTVAYNGNSSEFQPISEEAKQAVRVQYSEGKPYFVYVGTIQPRKNLVNLFKAYDRFRERCPDEVKLLVVGKKGWETEEIYRTHEQLSFKKDVIFTGPKYGEELNGLFAASVALTFVPYFEGFGLPILEAMCAETAVIAGAITCMPEVYGDAGIGVDPFALDQIAEAMLRLYQGPAYRERLIEKGRSQREKFSWDKTYEGVWKVLQQHL
ncbi:MAG: glycosyltransferase family 1 protein [Bacteroidota bacterium]